MDSKFKMSTEKFVKYVGEADFHDGVVVRVEQVGDIVSVELKGASARHYMIRFDGVDLLKVLSPKGMVIYAISEMETPVLRRFIFVNSDETSDSAIEVIARNVSWV